MSNIAQSQQPIVFFDGICGLCNRFVDFLIIADKKQQFLFAPLQGTTFQGLSQNVGEQFPDSVILYYKGAFFTKSTAALKILYCLGGIYVLSSIFYLLTKPVRDKLYDWVASNRYKWFGKKETCRLPSPEERLRFLD